MVHPRPDAASLHHPARARRSEHAAFWLFVGPLMLGLTVFIVVPVVWSLLISFSDARGNVSLGRWVGFENYRQLLGDPNFLRALRTSVVFTALIVPTTFALGLGLALLVTSVRRGQALYRSVFFLPTAVSYVVAALIWKLSLFNGLRFGLVNHLLVSLGLDPITWTFAVPALWVVLVSMRLWLQLGFNMILFIAGLNEIPQSLYEAARLDGAGGWTLFRRVTLPLLRNTSIFVLFTNVLAGFLAFDEFYNILQNGSGTGASTAGSLGALPPLWFVYDAAFGGGSQNYGVASAGSFVLALLMLLATLVQVRVFGLGRAQ